MWNIKNKGKVQLIREGSQMCNREEVLQKKKKRRVTQAGQSNGAKTDKVNKKAKLSP
jgi:hypothetical protein